MPKRKHKGDGGARVSTGSCNFTMPKRKLANWRKEVSVQIEVATLPCQSGNTIDCRVTAHAPKRRCNFTMPKRKPGTDACVLPPGGELQLYHAKAETFMRAALRVRPRRGCNFTMPKRKHAFISSPYSPELWLQLYHAKAETRQGEGEPDREQTLQLYHAKAETPHDE